MSEVLNVREARLRDAETELARVREALAFFEQDGTVEGLIAERDRFRQGLEEVRARFNPDLYVDDRADPVFQIVDRALTEEDRRA